MKKAIPSSRIVFILGFLLISFFLLLLLTACNNTNNMKDSVQNGGTEQNQNNIDQNSLTHDNQNPPNITDNLTFDLIDVNQEKIGCGYTVLEGQELDPNNSHGRVNNYHSTLQDNLWTVSFDAMNSTAYLPLEIDPRDTLKVKSKLVSGTVWIKITQGDLSKSTLQKIQLNNDEPITLDLSQWVTGEIAVWLVVEDGESGIIRVEQDFYAQRYITTLSASHITEKSWQSPEEIEVSLLLDCALSLTVNERVGGKGFRHEDQKLHVPAEMVEPLVYRFFDVSEDYLRSSSIYVPEEKSYVFRNVPMGSLFFKIDKVSRQNKIATIEFHYYNYPTLDTLKKVTLVVDESQLDNKYLSSMVNNPKPADQKATIARSPETFPAGFATGWSFTGKPQGETFNEDRNIYGVSFSLVYDQASDKYTYIAPGMGDCDKVISYTLTGTDFTVVLNGKYKLLYPDIPATVRFYEYANDHKMIPKGGYRIKSTDITTDARGNYYLEIPFDWPYQKGEITYLSFDFGKLD